MKSSSALPKAKAKAKARPKKTIAKYAHLPPDLRGAARFLDERNLIANINKVMNRDGRVETPLPRGDDPVHVGRVLGDIARRIDRSAGRSAPSARDDRSVSAMTRISEVSSRSPSRVGRSVAAMTPIPERRSRSPSAVSVASMSQRDPSPTSRASRSFVRGFVSPSSSPSPAGVIRLPPVKSALRPVQYGGSSSSMADPLGLFS